MGNVMSFIAAEFFNMTTSYRTVYAFAREMHPKTVKQDIQYGTAGFRTKASNLGYIMYRMGLLSVLRSRYKQGVIGVMITASHNPEGDNGVKLIDPYGEMLEQSWEKLATRVANVADDELESTIKDIVQEYNIDMSMRVNILIGKDTRPSSPSLAKSVIDGILALSGKPIDYGIVTTPQMHYFVRCKNTHSAYGIATEEGYYTKLVTAFKKLRGDTYNNGHYNNRLLYDGANGVGAKKIKYFKERLGECLNIELYNDAGIGTGKLNYLCGADYVKTRQAFPTGVPVEPNTRCVSVDGDVDRLIYYYVDEQNKFHILDGDKIGSLIAGYLKELVMGTGLDLDIGFIQSAYANGASTEYITQHLKVPVSCVPTGVKYLHHKALEYDIGVYFEANGHGTAVFSQDSKDKLKQVSINNSSTDTQKDYANQLLVMIDLINESTGDALSDMFVVETILHAKGWNIQQWDSTYSDLPNKLVPVTVEDRSVVTSTNAERRCVTPDGLQDEIDILVEKYSKARSFVRASGTEDVVRVYAEASTQEDVNRLAIEVALKVYEYASGVGPVPEI